MSLDKHFPIVFERETTPTSVNNTGLWRFQRPVRREKISPCRAMCPLQNGIPSWMDKIKKGEWEEAWHVIKEYNPFPAVTGYVCYHFCEDMCNRGSKDEKIAIGEIEKEIGIWRQENYSFDKEKKAKDKVLNHCKLSGNKVAIIGSGPAGLSCAYYLNKAGAQVTIFEKLPVAGGLLATGIPEYRFPRAVVQRELEILQSEGVGIKTNVEVGKDISLSEVKNEFGAILIATGAQQSKPLNVPGCDSSKVIGAIEFLRDISFRKINKVQGKVIVVGGGNAALDAACSAKNLGAEEVKVFYRRALNEMPAHINEIRVAIESGVKIESHTIINEVIDNGQGIEVYAVRTAPSKRGEKNLRVLPETDFYSECYLLIVATGQESSIWELMPSAPAGISERDNIIKVEEYFSNREKGVIFAAGDAIMGGTTVAKAIFSGRQAALNILNFLGPSEDSGEAEKTQETVGIAPPLGENMDVVGPDSLNPAYFRRKNRALSAEEEAGRCFSCGTCNKCAVCWTYCPDLAVESSSGDYNFLLNYCKGCGICVSECPAGVLVLEEEATANGA